MLLGIFMKVDVYGDEFGIARAIRFLKTFENTEEVDVS